MNRGPLNLFSKRLHLLSYANAPSEFLTREGEQPLRVEPPQQVPGFSFLQQIWLILWIFQQVKALGVWKEQGFVCISKGNLFRWFCLETQEGGKQRRRGGSKRRESGPSRALHRKLDVDRMPHVCTHAQQLHTQTHLSSSRHMQVGTHTNKHLWACIDEHTHRHAHTPAPSITRDIG